ncbi:hypothetical protein R3W88_004671 [Solanum pinnatisectum]|uniref:Aminotransferase-like plant mobile domain-containing protein n=1 Tax=Solanum pinnatisectum TaxID=50273 RepID=A0AAV9KBB7_9SOLN|nr:hypothetical protein R3W88_004671 [Solanum pinnatisectum]
MAGYSAYQLDPDPLEPSVLTQQLTHRSRDIWDGSVNMILNTRRCDGKFWDLVKKYLIHPRVLEVIELSGLYGVYRSNRPIIDCSLITSLVERWRLETHTFHFRTGEATITLQDVEVLYDLPMNGDLVLGFIPRPQDFNRSSLKGTPLNAHMLEQLQLPDLATQAMINQMARCYMFWMIAGMMMTDTSGNYLKLMYLPMLEDLNVVSSYSWGSATLACLYRFLCKASQSNQNEIAGFLPLLQSYCAQTQVIAQRDTENNFLAGLPRGPRATRWFAHFSWTDTTKQVLKVFRDALDSMTEDQFLWQPYSDDLIESFPDYCRIGRDIWRVRAPIFCWDVVEVHLPDRVMRQFGLKQTIPTPFLFDATHFHHNRRGRPNTNWKLEHAQWLPFWNQRLQYICDAPVNREPLRYDDPYLIWFRRITRLVIGNPTKRPQQQEGCVRHIHSMVDREKTLGDQPSMEDFYIFRAMVRNEGEKCLTYVHKAARIHVQADYRRDKVHDDHLHPPIHRRGKGGVAGRMTCAVEKGRAPIEMDESVSEDDHTTSDIVHYRASGMTYQPTNIDIVPYTTSQILRNPSLSSLENVFGGSRPQHFENAPNFNSSPGLPMSIETLMLNELDDSNDEVENANECGEPSVKENRTFFPKRCGTGTINIFILFFDINHGKKKQVKRNKEL